MAHPKPSLLHSQGGLSNIDVLLLNRSGNHSASGCIRGISHTSHVIAAFLYDETQVIQGPAFVVRPQGKEVTKIYNNCDFQLIGNHYCNNTDTSTTLTSTGQLWIILTSGFTIILF